MNGRYTVGEGCCVPLLRNRVGARGPGLELWSEKGSLHPGLVDLVSGASQVLLMGKDHEQVRRPRPYEGTASSHVLGFVCGDAVGQKRGWMSSWGILDNAVWSTE